MLARFFLRNFIVRSVFVAGVMALAVVGCSNSGTTQSTGDGDAGGSGGGPDDTESGGSSPGGGTSSGGDGGAGGDDSASPQIASIHITPGDIELSAIDGSQPKQTFAVSAVFSDGSESDVTDEATFELDDSGLGSIVGNEFISNGRKGGVGVLTASLEGETTSATITVDVTFVHLFESATSETPGLFEGANPQEALAPALVYPEPDSIAPPNLVELDVHFTDPSLLSDTFEISIEQPYFHLRAYLVDPLQSTHFATLGGDLWNLIRENGTGTSVEIGVRGLRSEEPTAVGVSLGQTLSIAAGPSEGQIFFRSEGGPPNSSGIYRYLMDDGEAEVEGIYTQLDEPTQLCVSCHSPNAGGTVFATTLDGGGGLGTVVETATGATVVPAVYSWNFASFDPGADEMLTVKDGVFSVRSALDGAVITGVTSTGQVTHPMFNSDGSMFAYVRTGVFTQDWIFAQGSILTRTYSRQDRTFGEEVMLVETTGVANNYYPVFSPGDEFVLFNRSTGTAMMDPTSDLYVVAAAGGSDPIPLALANRVGDITNSHPAWSSSTSTLGSGSDEQPVLWLVFASKRSFGVRLADGDRLQLWLAPFFPERARAGIDPSGPALHLPLQDLDLHNYLPTWVE